MQRTRRRTATAAVVSAAAHLLMLGVFALQAPKLQRPQKLGGRPPAIIPVLLAPKPPPARQTPIRLHRRPQPFVIAPAPSPLPVPPLIEPPRPPPAVVHPAPLPEGPTDQLRAALRTSLIGCANAGAVGLTRTEREACYEQFGRGAKAVNFPRLGLVAEKPAGSVTASRSQETCRADWTSTAGLQQSLGGGPC